MVQDLKMPQLKQPKHGSPGYSHNSQPCYHSCSRQAVIHPGSLSSGTRDIPVLHQESRLCRHGEDHFRQPDFCWDNLWATHPLGEAAPGHWAQQQPPAGCARLCKNTGGQGFSCPLLSSSHCQSLVHTEGSVNGLRTGMFRTIKECKNRVERTYEDQYFCWIDKPKLVGFLFRMENYHKTIQQKCFGQV